VMTDPLRMWKSIQAGKRLAAGEAWVDLDLVFGNDIGLPASENRVRHQFYRVLERAELKRMRLYGLRHTMATLVLSETKDLKLVAARLGHANEYLVLRRYGHLLPGADREATERLSEVIRKAGLRMHGTRMAHDAGGDGSE
ncbi:MAG: tyrosine-type recombinase/integrase, partial [Candidatus Dormibacteraeota bacterium]|nr:tyrosine-type recombinase/integrase [Candidatus Dormibacteraeota bacterium]